MIYFYGVISIKKEIAICLEASHARGLGHLFRGMTLARLLVKEGRNVRFLLNEYRPALDVLAEAGFHASSVPLSDQESGWQVSFIADHNVGLWIDDRLDTDASHARHVLSSGACRATFDDRGPGSALADMNIVAFPADGEHLCGRRVLSGVEYLVLDPCLRRYRRLRQEMRSIVVSMGGSDTYGVTIDVVRALRAKKLAATIIIGPGFEHHEALHGLLSDDFPLRSNVPVLAEEFSRHDLAITAGGLTPCEANAAGLPAIIVATEPWEVVIAMTLQQLGCSTYAGPRGAFDLRCLDAPLPVEAMSCAGINNVPHDGGDRIVQVLLSLLSSSKGS